jgi:HK97 family phage major capsid protein
MMWDADFLVSEIKNEHIPQLRRKLDYYLLSGNGTSPQILGVTQNAAAYTNTDLNGQVAGANYADAIRAAVNQIVNSNYIPNYVLMNPSDVALMELSKSNTLEYLNVTINGRIHGLPIIQNTGVTAGKVLVGDFSKVTLFYNGGIQISVFDQNESDPIYGLYTIVSKVRAASKIMVCDYTNAFVYDDLADIVNAIKA